MRDRYSFRAKEILGKRCIKKGDTILVSEPFAYVINHPRRGQFCDYCFTSHRSKTLISCKECNFVWYCDDLCRFGGQSVHKWECPALKRFHPKEPTILARLIARVMNALKNGGEKYVEYYGENKGRKFKDLMNHYRDIKEDDNRMKDVRGLIEELKEFTGEENFPNESDFIGIYGRILVNRYCLMDEYHSPVGTAVYLAASIFDHSCVPNAYPSFEKKKVVIRSLVDWAELDLNKVFISYIDVAITKKQRQMQLRSNWFFICQCPLCSSNERDLFENCMKCENPMCGELNQIPEKPDSQFSCREAEAIKCTACKCLFDKETITEYQAVIAFTRPRLKGMKEESPCIDTCIAILEKQADLLPPVNVWRVRTLDFAFNAAVQLGVWIRAMEYGKNNLEGVRLYYGADHPTVGLFLMKLSKVCMFLKIYRDGIKYGEEAKRILKISLGANHILITEELKRIIGIASEDVEILLERRLEAKKLGEHELFCKHCGRRKGAMHQVEKEINVEKRKKVTTNKIKENKNRELKPPENTNFNAMKNEKLKHIENGKLKPLENGDIRSTANGVSEDTGNSSPLNGHPDNTKKMCKFATSGETETRLSERVLDYLLSLKDF